MKKLAVILMALVLSASLTACGGKKPDPADTPDVKNVSQEENNTENENSDDAENTDAENENPDGTDSTDTAEEPEEVSLVAVGKTCTITVPKLETFFDGYKGATVKYNNPANTQVFVNLYRDDPALEVNVSVAELTISSLETKTAESYAEYYNEKSKIYHYDPVEIAGFSGYIASRGSESTKLFENVYIIDYPLSDGTSAAIILSVTQKYADDTSEIVPIAEAFLKNIEVTANNG